MGRFFDLGPGIGSPQVWKHAKSLEPFPETCVFIKMLISPTELPNGEEKAN